MRDGYSPDRGVVLAKCALILGAAQVSEDQNFFELGGDSLQALEISGVLTAEYEAEVSFEEVLNSETFGSLLTAAERSR